MSDGLGKVLSVENNPATLDRLLRPLEDAGFTVLSASDLRTLEYLLSAIGPGQMPGIALLDLDMGLDGEFTGLGALLRILAHPEGQRVTPILFSDGFDSNIPEDRDLHAVLCAHAMARAVGDSGILAAPKSRAAVEGILSAAKAKLKANDSPFGKMQIHQAPPGLMLVRPVYFERDNAAKLDLVEVLLGSHARRAFWRIYAETESLNHALETIHSQWPVTSGLMPKGDTKQGKTAGSRSEKRSVSRAGTKWPANNFLGKTDIGDLFVAWAKAGRTFRDVETLYMPDVDHRIDRQGVFNQFFARYNQVLTHSDTANFADQYLAKVPSLPGGMGSSTGMAPLP